jgi:hypothetical protein
MFYILAMRMGPMNLREAVRKILNIIADKTESSSSMSVMDTAVIRDSSLPVDEARKYLTRSRG